MEFLEGLDHRLLLLVNGAHTGFLDVCMVWISRKTTWIPLYLLAAVLLFYKYKLRAFLLIACAIMTIVLTDQVSNQLFKELVARYRPCHNPTLLPYLHLVNNKCGGLYGFVSSHAANTAGLATFLLTCGLGGWSFRKPGALAVSLLLVLYALLNAYSRVYLGMHYPADVACGALLGMLIGWGMAKAGLFLAGRYFSPSRA